MQLCCWLPLVPQRRHQRSSAALWLRADRISECDRLLHCHEVLCRLGLNGAGLSTVERIYNSPQSGAVCRIHLAHAARPLGMLPGCRQQLHPLALQELRFWSIEGRRHMRRTRDLSRFCSWTRTQAPASRRCPAIDAPPRVETTVPAVGPSLADLGDLRCEGISILVVRVERCPICASDLIKNHPLVLVGQRLHGGC